MRPPAVDGGLLRRLTAARIPSVASRAHVAKRGSQAASIWYMITSGWGRRRRETYIAGQAHSVGGRDVHVESSHGGGWHLARRLTNELECCPGDLAGGPDVGSGCPG